MKLHYNNLCKLFLHPYIEKNASVHEDHCADVHGSQKQVNYVRFGVFFIASCNGPRNVIVLHMNKKTAEVKGKGNLIAISQQLFSSRFKTTIVFQLVFMENFIN